LPLKIGFRSADSGGALRFSSAIAKLESAARRNENANKRVIQISEVGLQKRGQEDLFVADDYAIFQLGSSQRNIGK
jgi:hypothetical protein